jgi:hypothetical protein
MTTNDSANSSATLSAEFEVRLVVAGHEAVPLTASLYYYADDPFAIRMAFDVHTDEPVEWIFDRDLLATGLQEPAGEGDVRISPGNRVDRDVLNIVLTSPSGHARFEAPLSATATFVQRTFAVVAAGHETDSIDLGRQIRELIWPELPAQ